MHKKSFFIEAGCRLEIVINQRKERKDERNLPDDKEEIVQHQHVSEKGLTESRVQEIRQKIGENQLQATKKKSPVRIFAEQFQDLLVIILMIAAVVSMLSRNVESTVVIFVVIVMNAVLERFNISRQKNHLILSMHFHHHMQKYFVMVKK